MCIDESNLTRTKITRRALEKAMSRKGMCSFMLVTNKCHDYNSMFAFSTNKKIAKRKHTSDNEDNEDVDNAPECVDTPSTILFLQVFDAYIYLYNSQTPPPSSPPGISPPSTPSPSKKLKGTG